MNKKAIYSILSTIVAMVVLSVSLVFAIGPHISAAHVDEGVILVFDSWDDFNIDDNGVLTGLSESALAEIDKYQIYEDCMGYFSSEGVDEIKYIIPDGVKVLDCEYVGLPGGDLITLLELPDGLEEIGSQALCAFHSLTNITIPNTVKVIGHRAFGDCDSLTSIIIPESVIEMDDEYIFDNCVNLEKIYCAAVSKPAGWNNKWNHISYPYDIYVDVVWDCYKTVTFETKGGNVVNSQEIFIEKMVAEPTAPIKDGYAFKGWYTDAECTDAYDFETAVTDDMTLYAKWEEVQVQPEPGTPGEETSTAVNNQNNNALIWCIAGTAAGILIVAGIIVGIVISKRRRK